MTFTIELPDNLVEQFRDRQIPEEELKAVAIAALEAWLAQRGSSSYERFAESPVQFTRRLIEKNRQLFEALARR